MESVIISQGARREAAEFFAGIGLVRSGIEQAGFRVVFANDIERSKVAVYAANFDASHYRLDDVRNVRGGDVPSVDLATASFPCTDLSLAGNRAGLRGKESSMFWQFARVLREMDRRRPKVVMLENVPGFATSRGGTDLQIAIAELNDMGYACDLLILDARHFVPQSRQRLFIVGSQERLRDAGDWQPTPIRPAWIGTFVRRHPELNFQVHPIAPPPVGEVRTLGDIVERMHSTDARWWDRDRTRRFTASLSELQAQRLRYLRDRSRLTWATAYRRTRAMGPTWEIRADDISGCLRTARGGSSRQAVIEAGRGSVRVRWMTPREYARLQGVPDFNLHAVTENQALFGLGDAVCVPVVAWLAQNYLRPLVDGDLTKRKMRLSVPGYVQGAAAS